MARFTKIAALLVLSTVATIAAGCSDQKSEEKASEPAKTEAPAAAPETTTPST